jgi:hypothetical protein
MARKKTAAAPVAAAVAGSVAAGTASSAAAGSPARAPAVSLPPSEAVKQGVRSQADVAKEATQRVRREQEKRATTKVRVICTKRFWDGFKLHEEGDRFVWANDDSKRWPSALVREDEYDAAEKARRLADRDAEFADVGDEE